MIYNDEIIINLFWDKRQCNGKRYNKILFKENNIEIISYLKNRYNDFNSFKETLYRIKNNINEIPKCPICGKETTFINISHGYHITCGNKKCIYELSKISIIKKYGVDNVAKLDVVKDKIKNTFEKNYGVSNPNKCKEIRNKIKQTCLEKYGVEHHWNNDVIKEKRHQTWLKKYGVDICSQADVVKEKMSKTVEEKYGVKWFTQTQKLIKASNTEETKNKEFKTKIKNMNFSKSKEEDKLYELLLAKFKNVKRQYKDKNLYPFYCDFYLPNENIWIEYNGSQFHHYKPYENNENDIIELNNLKNKSIERKNKTNKNTSIYDSIIYTWTNLDVRKRNIAKENNLNYLEFYNIKEAINWINNFK